MKKGGKTFFRRGRVGERRGPRPKRSKKELELRRGVVRKRRLKIDGPAVGNQVGKVYTGPKYFKGGGVFFKTLGSRGGK